MKNFKRLLRVTDRCHMVVLAIDSPLAAIYRKLHEEIEMLAATKSREDYSRIVATWAELVAGQHYTKFPKEDRATLEIAFAAAHESVQAVSLYMAGEIMRSEARIQEAQALICQYH